MNKFRKYQRACKFAESVKLEVLSSGVTIHPFSNEVIVSHKDHPHLGFSCYTPLGLKRAISKVEKQVASL